MAGLPSRATTPPADSLKSSSRRSAGDSAKKTNPSKKGEAASDDVLDGFVESARNKGWVFLCAGDDSAQEKIRADLIAAGAFCIRVCASYKDACTHVVMPELARTDKFFCAVAAGKPVLTREYATACKAARRLLDPLERYEWCSDKVVSTGKSGKKLWMAASHKWRLFREEHGHGPFKGWRVSSCGLEEGPRKLLEKVITLGDGEVVPLDDPHITHVFTASRTSVPGHVWRRELPVLLNDYAFDYLALQHPPSLDDAKYRLYK
jgi:topoisomerase (DNA) II binding protein 1